MALSILVAAAFLSAGSMLKPGDHTRNLKVDGKNRSYLVHVPKKYDGKTPMPVVLALHGAAMNGPMMTAFCGLNEKADNAGFIVVYPSGGAGMGIFLAWNASGRKGKDRADDVAYIRAVLDDLESVAKVDTKRVYAAGMSNGAMMCYLLAAELSDRIAAIAPVGGTMVVEKANPKRPVPVIHFHGTDDKLVPFNGPSENMHKYVRFKSVEDSIQTWVKIDGCDHKPEVVQLPDKANDGTTISAGRIGTARRGQKWSWSSSRAAGIHGLAGNLPLASSASPRRTSRPTTCFGSFFKKHPMK